MTTHAGIGRGDRSWAAVAALALLLAMLAIAATLSAPPARSQGESGGRFLGVASCAGSTCHGRMEGDGVVVRQDELMRWQEPSTPGGAHSRAWAVLNTSRSQFIARNLGIGDPARASMCLGCHSDAATSRGTAPIEDGVTCESC
ncbi:MAG TPA: multiheme c-type cytochrome, partial [Sphingopyxis terrae]|nr:multiheme c-type cytochrome [Sphingopyxis terrae]